ncbi:hypothetical protein WMY93_006937 [Mugilogobius chulae]|uniref:Rho-GAP domain-containing protein n=1 Tax=Mugilogobius chulae TaxID=88201 RepID=A0AAW0PUS2_9GOBI
MDSYETSQALTSPCTLLGTEGPVWDTSLYQPRPSVCMFSQHSKAAVKVKEDMLKMVQIPILKPRGTVNNQARVFGKSLSELQEQGLLKDGLPLVVRRMVEHLRCHGLNQEGLFRVNANVRAVESLKQRLDLDCEQDLHLVSESDVSTVANFGDSGSCADMTEVLLRLPDVHFGLLQYLCHFLTQVERNHKENRMTAHNLATVFGPSVFHVAAGFEAMKDQTICNKIMVKLIQNYNAIFEAGQEIELCVDEYPTLIIVKAAQSTDFDTKQLQSSPNLTSPQPAHEIKVEAPTTNAESLDQPCMDAPKPRPRKPKVRERTRSDTAGVRVLPRPNVSSGDPNNRPLVLPITRSPETSETELRPWCPQSNVPNSSSLDTSSYNSMESMRSSQEEDDDDDDEERPISPFYRSHLLSPRHRSPDVVDYLEGTVRSTVEQHLFGITPCRGQRSEDSNQNPKNPTGTPTARERRRSQRQQDTQSRAASARTDTNKENIQSSSRNTRGGALVVNSGQRNLVEQTSRAKKWRHSPTLAPLSDNQDAHESHMQTRKKMNMSTVFTGKISNYKHRLITLRMKIQESPVACDTGRVGVGGGGGSDPDCDKSGCEDVPRLDLTALTEDNNWGEPVPAYPLLQRESMDREEARLSPHGGGRLIRQLLDEDSDPMVSPRFYAYGHGQQYLEDTEVPPSPPNAHSFISRRRKKDPQIRGEIRRGEKVQAFPQ